MSNINNETTDHRLSYFSNATQTAFVLVEKALRKNKDSTADLNDLYYFGCIFLGVLQL